MEQHNSFKSSHPEVADGSPETSPLHSREASTTFSRSFSTDMSHDVAQSGLALMLSKDSKSSDMNRCSYQVSGQGSLDAVTAGEAKAGDDQRSERASLLGADNADHTVTAAGDDAHSPGDGAAGGKTSRKGVQRGEDSEANDSKSEDDKGRSSSNYNEKTTVFDAVSENSREHDKLATTGSQAVVDGTDVSVKHEEAAAEFGEVAQHTDKETKSAAEVKFQVEEAKAAHTRQTTASGNNKDDHPAHQSAKVYKGQHAKEADGNVLYNTIKTDRYTVVEGELQRERSQEPHRVAKMELSLATSHGSDVPEEEDLPAISEGRVKYLSQYIAKKLSHMHTDEILSELPSRSGTNRRRTSRNVVDVNATSSISSAAPATVEAGITSAAKSASSSNSNKKTYMHSTNDCVFSQVDRREQVIRCATAAHAQDTVQLPAPLRHTFAVVNVDSGNRGSARFVVDVLRRQLGEHRVFRLTAGTFTDTSALRQGICNYAMRFVQTEKEAEAAAEAVAREPVQLSPQSPLRNSSDNDGDEWSAAESNRGTVIVAGGDGTVGYVMSVIDELQRELDKLKMGGTETDVKTYMSGDVQRSRESANNRNRGSKDDASKKDASERTKSNVNPLCRRFTFESDNDEDTSNMNDDAGNDNSGKENAREGKSASTPRRNAAGLSAMPWFITPAVAPLPLGTGNDFALSIGFGKGYTRPLFLNGLSAALCCGRTDSAAVSNSRVRVTNNNSSSDRNNTMGRKQNKKNSNTSKKKNMAVSREEAYMVEESSHAHRRNSNYSSSDVPDAAAIDSATLTPTSAMDGAVLGQTAAERHLMTLLRRAVSAPCAPFDRWMVEFVPLHVAQKYVRSSQEVQQLVEQHPRIFLSPPRHSADVQSEGADVALPCPEGLGRDDARDGGRASAAEERHSGTPNAKARLSRLAAHINVGNLIHMVDWNRVRADAQTHTRAALINFSMGYDAYITRRFDTTRRNHPRLCSNRIQNKMVYGVMGLLASTRCRTLRPMVPMVCVPQEHVRLTGGRESDPSRRQSNSSSKESYTATAQREDARATAQTGHGNVQDACDPALREMTSLQLPGSCKALMVTNISKYASGGQPWQSKHGRTFHRPVNMQCDKLAPIDPVTGLPMDVGAAAADGEEEGTTHTTERNDSRVSGESSRRHRRGSARTPVPPTGPIAINDRMFELHAMGGLLNYSAMEMGLSGSDKLLQTDEVYLFVLCTPDDLRYAPRSYSPFTQEHLSKFARQLASDESSSVSTSASLNVQIDGEALPQIKEPTIVHVQPVTTHRIRVRCLDNTVVASKD